MLALAGGNSRLLSLFGADVKPWRNTNYTAELEKASLPQPFLSVACPDTLRSNLHLIDSKLSAMSKVTGCNSANNVFLILLFVFSIVFT